MNKSSIVIYRIKNLLFLVFLYSCIKLIPNIYEVGLIGKIFLWISIIYTLVMFICYIMTNKNLNSNIIHNLLSIMLYFYIFLISNKYTQVVNSSIFAIDNMYFKINYVIASLAFMGIIVDSFVLLKEKKSE